MVATAVVVPLADGGQCPFIEFFNGMAAQPKGKTQMTYGRVFGQQNIVYREPLEGTVPRDIAAGCEYHAYSLRPQRENTDRGSQDGWGRRSDQPACRSDAWRTWSVGRTLYNTYCSTCATATSGMRATGR